MLLNAYYSENYASIMCQGLDVTLLEEVLAVSYLTAVIAHEASDVDHPKYVDRCYIAGRSVSS